MSFDQRTVIDALQERGDPRLFLSAQPSRKKQESSTQSEDSSISRDKAQAAQTKAEKREAVLASVDYSGLVLGSVAILGALVFFMRK